MRYDLAAILSSLLVVAPLAHAQTPDGSEPEPTSAPAEAEAPPADDGAVTPVSDDGADSGPADDSAPADASGEAADASGEAAETDAAPEGMATLRLYVITNQNAYARFGYDVYDNSNGVLVKSAVSPNISTGEEAEELVVEPGTYKIVRSNAPYETMVDFATVELHPDTLTDYVIVIDASNLAFRGSGVVSGGELPVGTKEGGVSIALTGGAGANLGYRRRVVGTTPGQTANLNFFANFSLLWDRGPHHLQVQSDFNLNFEDPAFGKPYASFQQFETSALYSFNINNDYIGPYVRAGFRTNPYPGYLYLDGDADQVNVLINRADGTSVSQTYGDAANLDDIRVKLSDPLDPFILQEEIGANLKAFDLNLLILETHIASRIGYGFRQGLVQDLLIYRGDAEGNRVILDEQDSYYTHGPIIGADANVSFLRWIYASGRFGMMIPLQDKEDAGSDFGDRLLIDLSGTAGLKLPSITSFLYASLDYTFRVTRDGFLTQSTQFDQMIMARLNVKVF